MSIASTHPTAYGPQPGAAPDPYAPRPGEACPLCGTPLHPDQDWCLHCGAAARTRLAAAPNWRAPLAVFAAVVVILLGVLAAGLVKLAGGSGTPVTNTRTVTAPAAAALAPAAAPKATATPATPAATAPTTTPANGAATATTPGANSRTPSAGAGSSATTPRTGTVPTLPGIDSATPGAK